MALTKHATGKGRDHPLARFAGIFKDDAIFEEVMANIEAASERQRAEAIREAEEWERTHASAARSNGKRKKRAA